MSEPTRPDAGPGACQHAQRGRAVAVPGVGMPMADDATLEAKLPGGRGEWT